MFCPPEKGSSLPGEAPKIQEGEDKRFLLLLIFDSCFRQRFSSLGIFQEEGKCCARHGLSMAKWPF